MRKTLSMCEFNVDCINSCLYESGYSTYYRINQRNGYKALDMYERCDECVKNDEKQCRHDTLIKNAGCFTTSELYHCTCGMLELVRIRA